MNELIIRLIANVCLCVAILLSIWIAINIVLYWTAPTDKERNEHRTHGWLVIATACLYTVYFTLA